MSAGSLLGEDCAQVQDSRKSLKLRVVRPEIAFNFPNRSSELRKTWAK